MLIDPPGFTPGMPVVAIGTDRVGHKPWYLQRRLPDDSLERGHPGPRDSPKPGWKRNLRKPRQLVLEVQLRTNRHDFGADERQSVSAMDHTSCDVERCACRYKSMRRPPSLKTDADKCATNTSEKMTGRSIRTVTLCSKLPNGTKQPRSKQALLLRSRVNLDPDGL